MDTEWFSKIARFLNGWPSDYLVIDLETNGFAKPVTTVPMQVGWCLVEGRKIADCNEIVLNWAHPSAQYDFDTLRTTTAATAASMAKAGNYYPFNVPYLEANGDEPDSVLHAYGDLIEYAIAAQIPILGFNVWAFDIPITERTLKQQLGRELVIDSRHVIDVMCIEKARLLKKPIPTAGPRHYWYDSLKGHRVSCNLHKHCAEVYKLPVDFSRAHGAAYDCELTHRVFEEMRPFAAM